MSPEQFAGKPTDSRSDEWSFCAALYAALYGTRPFAGDTLVELSKNVIAGKLRPPPADTKVPVLVWNALQRGLSTDPERRFPSMAELLAALHIDPERHPAGASTGRRLFVSLLLAAFGVLLASLKYWPSGSERQARVVFVAAAGMGVLILGSLVALLHAQLWRNTFHRGLIKLLAIQMGLVFALRILEVFVLKMEPQQALSIELLVMSGSFALIAAEYLPGAWFVAAACAVVSVWMAVRPLEWINLFYMVVFTALGLLWTHAARAKNLSSAG
jgi:hypothetical protein